MRSFDRPLPREWPGLFGATCNAEPLTCQECGHVVPFEYVKRCQDCKSVDRLSPNGRRCECGGAGESIQQSFALRCAECGSIDLQPMKCEECWRSDGHATEHMGVELKEPRCPNCDHDAEEVDEV